MSVRAGQELRSEGEREPTDDARAGGPGGWVRRARPGASWEERCAELFEDLRKPARVMIARAFGSALGTAEVEDVYANAWASTLTALRGRAQRMSDSELRSYLLTAVASHASKEMRRRARKPTSALEANHAQVLADAHSPSPEERAVGTESRSLARDVLASLPARRRAVMLLRYGWGLEPRQVCRLVEGLSPRAYRKEITRGVEQMIERLRQADSGEWCRSREPILRDYVAGTADEHGRLQATQHMRHCRSCTDLVGRLEAQLHDLGSTLAWSGTLGTLGERELSLAERLGGIGGRGRETASSLLERGEGGVEALGSLGAAGGVRGAGAAGAGALAKLAGLGAAGKAAVACLGASVAASACVVSGVVPAIGVDRPDGARAGPAKDATTASARLRPTPSVDAVAIAEPEPGPAPAAPSERRPVGGGGADQGEPEPLASEVAVAPTGAPADSPAPSAPPEQQEFGLPAAATGGGGGGGGGSPSSAGGDDVAREFGP